MVYLLQYVPVESASPLACLCNIYNLCYTSDIRLAFQATKMYLSALPKKTLAINFTPFHPLEKAWP